MLYKNFNIWYTKGKGDVLMEEIINIIVQNGLGVGSFIAFLFFIFRYEDKQSETLKGISDTLLQVQITLSSLAERVDNIERKVNNEKE